MIIGNGLLAKFFLSEFHNDENVIIFASGVSNSLTVDPIDFDREKKLLINEIKKNKLLIYFGSLSATNLDDELSPYLIHKLKMEELVKSSKKFIIFRLPQIVGPSGNPNTLTNYIYNKIKNNQSFQVWGDVKRNFIDVKDMASIVSYIIKREVLQNSTINIATPFFVQVIEIVKIFELILNKNALFQFLSYGKKFDNETSYDISICLSVANKISINFNDLYLKNLLIKYYG